MRSPIKLTRNEQVKLLFILLAGVLNAFTDRYATIAAKNTPSKAGYILGSALGSFLICWVVGIIIYGIVRIFRKPKEQKSLFRHGLFYGFWVAMLFVVMQVFMLVELLIMSS